MKKGGRGGLMAGVTFVVAVTIHSGLRGGGLYNLLIINFTLLGFKDL